MRPESFDLLPQLLQRGQDLRHSANGTLEGISALVGVLEQLTENSRKSLEERDGDRENLLEPIKDFGEPLAILNRLTQRDWEIANPRREVEESSGACCQLSNQVANELGT